MVCAPEISCLSHHWLNIISKPNSASFTTEDACIQAHTLTLLLHNTATSPKNIHSFTLPLLSARTHTLTHHLLTVMNVCWLRAERYLWADADAGQCTAAGHHDIKYIKCTLLNVFNSVCTVDPDTTVIIYNCFLMYFCFNLTVKRVICHVGCHVAYLRIKLSRTGYPQLFHMITDSFLLAC